MITTCPFLNSMDNLDVQLDNLASKSERTSSPTILLGRHQIYGIRQVVFGQMDQDLPHQKVAHGELGQVLRLQISHPASGAG